MAYQLFMDYLMLTFNSFVNVIEIITRFSMFQCFIFNALFYNHLFAVIYHIFLSNTNNLHTAIWFQIFQSNSNNSCTIIVFQVTNDNKNDNFK